MSVFRWNEIAEFRRYRTIGMQVNVWLFYVKIINADNKKKLFSESIVNKHDLVDAIFSKAVNARFVINRNVSSIPFIKKGIIENWEDSKDFS